MGETNLINDRIDEVAARFRTKGAAAEHAPYGNGHINDTFLVVCGTQEGERRRYILQKMNHSIFKMPQQLMENVVNVTEYLREMIARRGGDPDRETLNVVYETIPNFHNTPSRFSDFQRAVQEDRMGRAAQAKEEIAFALAREADTRVLTDMLKAGELPLRVTHNDTKLNNILFDADTKKAICIIDLDTVMPGLSHYDFGDSIRFGASTGAEDEKDLDKIEMDLSLFEAFTKGYLEGCGGSLTEKEIEMLPMGAKLMTYECGIRFLADFLEGDTYFKIHRDGHNLDRARTQFKLVKDMEDKWADMAAIVEKYKNMY